MDEHDDAQLVDEGDDVPPSPTSTSSPNSSPLPAYKISAKSSSGSAKQNVIRAISCANFRIEKLAADGTENDSTPGLVLPRYNTSNEVSSSIEGTPAMIMDEEEVLLLQPMDRAHGGWDEDIHFCPMLGIEGFHGAGENEVRRGGGWVVTFEALANECIAIALSPQPRHITGKTYVAHLGANRNLATVLRRHTVPTGVVEVDRPSRICSPFRFIPYWVVLKNGKFSAGLGEVIGENTSAIIDDSLYNALRSGMDAPCYVGIGNSAVGRGARNLRVRKVCLSPCPLDLVVKEEEAFVRVSDTGDGFATQMEERLAAEYAEECVRNKKRAEKFGLPYVGPVVADVLRWSEAKVLIERGERKGGSGFITGIDLTSEGEKLKMAERAKRFEMEDEVATKRGRDDDEGNSSSQEMEDDLSESEEEREEGEEELVTPDQAWDNQGFLGKYRVDPILETVDEEGGEEMGTEENETDVLIPEKIHLFCLDCAAFKQMRNNDLMEYFSDYGPYCIEWLGEFSCNIIFQDRHTASRALNGLTQVIGVPPSEGFPDLNALGWRICNKPLKKIANDNYGRRGSITRILMRIATARDVLENKPEEEMGPPPGFTTKKVLGPGSEFEAIQQQMEIDEGRKSGNSKGGGKGKRRKRRRKANDEDAADNGEDEEIEMVQDGERGRGRNRQHRHHSRNRNDKSSTGDAIVKKGRGHRDKTFNIANRRSSVDKVVHHVEDEEPRGLDTALKSSRSSVGR